MRNMKRAKNEYIFNTEITQSVPRKFEDRLLQAQQFYTSYYTKFKTAYLPIAATELAVKTLKSTQVPFVSTADIQSMHAVRYAVGDKVYGFDHQQKRAPEYDDMLEPKHRYVGFVYLSIHPVEDYHPETHHHVPSLAQDNFISVLSHILYERENTFFSDMAANRIRHIQAIKFPSFKNDHIKIMMHKYGLDLSLFDAFKNAFELSRHLPTQRKLLVMLLGEHMAAYHSMYLHHKARQKITEDNISSNPKKSVMLYRTQHGGFSNKNTKFVTPCPAGNEDHKRSKRITHRIATFSTQLSQSPLQEENSDEASGEIDLIVSSTKRSRSHSYIRAEFQGEPVMFEVHTTGGDGNCGFFGLPIAHDRKGIVNLLFDNRNNDKVREKVAHEILSLLFIDVLPENDYPSLINFKSLMQAYSGQDPESIAQCEATRRDYIKKAMSIEIFTQFVSDYIGGIGEISFTVTGKTLTDGCSLLDAVVDLLRLHLVIWERDIHNPTEAAIVYNYAEHGQIHHLLHTRGQDTHFELLSVVSKVTLNSDDLDGNADEFEADQKRFCDVKII